MPISNPDERRKYQREWIARRRSEWFSGKTCRSCGSNTNLRLDHIDPNTKIDHRVWSWSTARRDSELAKCQVLCDPCHQRKTTLNGEHATGEHNGLAKLTDAQVIEAHALYTAGSVTFKELSIKYGVSRPTINQAIRGRTWKKHLP